MSRLSLKSVDDDVFGCIQMLVSDEQYESMQESEPDSNDIVCFSQKVYGFCWGPPIVILFIGGIDAGPMGLSHTLVFRGQEKPESFTKRDLLFFAASAVLISWKE
jgi:hypothetical protein